MKLHDFYFAQEAAFLIPIEHLDATGMSTAYRTALLQARNVTSDWVDCFNTAFRSYFERVQALYDAAPGTWFPPRVQNLCVVTQAAMTRPYFQIFPAASWLLYETDFVPVGDHPELASYLLLHAERLGLSKDIVTAFVHNIGYFLQRSDDELQRFHEQAAASRRPDADAFRAFAELLPQLPRIYHPTLNPPPAELPEKCGRIKAADLAVPHALQPAFKNFARAAKASAENVVQAYLTRQRQGHDADHAGELVAWLQAHTPRVLLAINGEVVWDPEQPEACDAVREAFATVGALPAIALRADVAVIDERSRSFIGALVAPDDLPRGDNFEQEGGVYIHEGRHLIVYDAAEPSLNRLQEGSPPYLRWLLGARTVHEWGHLAAEAGLVRVPAELAQAERAARNDVALLLRRLIGDASGPLAAVAAEEQASFGGANDEPGEAWMHYLLSRLPDYQTNLLARHFLPTHELEAYVRVNVRNHAQDGIGPYQQLMRYAFEFQYLALSGVEDKERYLMASTWFDELFVKTGIISVDRMKALWRAVERVCDCQRIDESAFKQGSLSNQTYQAGLVEQPDIPRVNFDNGSDEG